LQLKSLNNLRNALLAMVLEDMTVMALLLVELVMAQVKKRNNMKVSKLIEKLQAIQDAMGDLTILMDEGWGIAGVEVDTAGNYFGDVSDWSVKADETVVVIESWK